MRIKSLAWLAFTASLCHPIISFIAYNRSDLTPEQTLFSLGLMALFAALECGLIAAIARACSVRFSHMLIVAALFNAAFFNYDSWVTQWTHRNEVWEPFISFIIVTACTIALLLRYGKLKVLAQLLSIFFIGASILPTYEYGHFIATRMGQYNQPPTAEEKSAIESKYTPNIYHIMADGYARHDMLKRLGHDNKPFLDGLSARGFVVPKHAIANYPLTRYSVSSMQAMDYMFAPGVQMPLQINFYYHMMKEDNAALAAYRARGYRYIYADNRRYNPRLDCPDNVDTCLLSPQDAWYAWRSVFTPLLKKTPIYNFIRLLHGGLSADELQRLLDAQQLESLAPFYMFAMTLPPHYPYLYNPDCSLREPERESYDRFDAEGDVQGYLSNVACTSRMLLQLTDAIIARDPDAIILIHGDHGSSFSFKKALPCPSCMSAAQMAERYPILAAMRLPKRCKSTVPNTLSPVNFHRIILACMHGTPPKLLPDIGYINWYPFAYGGGDMFVYETNPDGLSPSEAANITRSKGAPPRKTQ